MNGNTDVFSCDGEKAQNDDEISELVTSSILYRQDNTLADRLAEQVMRSRKSRDP